MKFHFCNRDEISQQYPDSSQANFDRGTGWSHLAVDMERHMMRKPTEKKLTSEVLRKMPEAGLFTELRTLEERLDTLINRKRLDLQDMIGRSMRKNKTLRIFVSSSVSNQPWQQEDSFMGEEPPATGDLLPNWTLRVEGRLIDDDENPSRRPFSSMLTSIIVELNRIKEEGLGDLDVLVDANSTSEKAQEVVEWHEISSAVGASSAGAEQNRIEFDVLNIQRNGDHPVKAKIIMQLKEYPDKFKLSPQLADILGVTEESKPGAVVYLWQYIRFHKLQDVDERRMIKCDGPLKELFKRETIAFPQLVELLSPHMSPREPLTIEYTIEVDKDLASREYAFDVPIQVDHPSRQYLLAMLNSWHHDSNALRHLDDLVIQDVQSLNLLAHQHDFYTDFAADPLGFLDRWVTSQARDLRIIYSDHQLSEEAVRHSSFYDEDTLNQSLHLFLNNLK